MKKEGPIIGSTVVLLVAFLGGLIFFAPSCDGYEQDVVALAKSCPMAVEHLGPTIERDMWGYQPGSSSGRSGNRFVKQDVLLKGNKSSGSVEINALKHSNVWTIRTAVLHVAGKEIELTRCGVYMNYKMPSPRTFQGSVTSTEGGAPVKKGDKCSMTIQSTNDGEECRAQVDCGGKLIYGSTKDLGFNLCGYVATGQSTKALVVLDTDRRLGRSEPTLKYDERTKIAQLESEHTTGDQKWSVSLTLNPL